MTSNLKILQVGSSLRGSGGIEKSILYLAQGLHDRGHSVQVTAPLNSWLWQRACDCKLDVIALDVNAQQDVHALAKYVRMFQKHRFDIVNTHFSPDYIVPAVAAQFTKQQATVMTRYMVLPYKGVKRWLYGSVLYDKIIAVSNAVRQELITAGMPPDKVVVAHGGVPIHVDNAVRTDLSAELGMPSETVLVGIVARIARKKGHAILVRAMRYVDPRAVCIIVGTGPEEPALRELVRKDGLQDRVLFFGWRHDIDAIMAGLDIVVQPSIWEEACSLSIMEAMSLAKPLIVTRSGGNPELIKDGVSGLIVPKGDVYALADALNLLVQHVDLRVQMGQAGRKHQQTMHSVESMVQATERVYWEVVKKQSAR